MSALVIGRNQVHEFLGVSCPDTWFKVVPDEVTEDTRYRALIVVCTGPNAKANQNFLRDQIREDRNNVGRLNRWIDFLTRQNWASVFTVGVESRFGGGVVFHKPNPDGNSVGDEELISAPFCITRLGDNFDGYVIQRAFDNAFRQVVDNTNGDDDEAAQLILNQLIEAGALKGYTYVHEYH